MKTKVELFIAAGLDGYIARKDESIDRLFMDGDCDLRQNGWR